MCLSLETIHHGERHKLEAVTLWAPAQVRVLNTEQIPLRSIYLQLPLSFNSTRDFMTSAGFRGLLLSHIFYCCPSQILHQI